MAETVLRPFKSGLDWMDWVIVDLAKDEILQIQ